ncbi:MAG: MFS transporter, partial [Oscillospiraceae bacterium]
MENRKKLHYGWLIVLSCFMIMSFYLCIVMNCPGLFIIPVTTELGVSRSQYALNTTVISISMMAVALSAGKIFSKVKIRKVMSVAAFVLPLAYACYSRATSITMFYGVSMVVGLCLGLCGMVPMSTLITRWFNEKRGLATGMAFTGSGIGGMILQPIIGQLIANVGWRKTYFILGIVMFIAVVPCVVCFIRDDPSEKNLEPYGKAPVNKGAVNADGLTFAQAKKTPQMWLLLPIATISSAACSSMVQQIAPYAMDIGYSSTVAANIGAISLGTLAVGKIILGQLYDMKGSKFGTYMSVGAIVAALTCYTMASAQAILYVGIIFSGLGIAFSTVGYPIVTQSLFGKKDYSAIYGWVSCAGSIGTAIGSPLTSMIFDATGSYRMAWIVWSVACVVLLII